MKEDVTKYNPDLYEYILNFRPRGSYTQTDRTKLPLGILPNELHELLTAKYGVEFDCERLLSEGELLTAHYRLNLKIVGRTDVVRPPVSKVLAYKIVGIKYALSNGHSLQKAMRDSHVCDKDKEEVMKLLSSNDFVTDYEVYAYSN